MEIFALSVSLLAIYLMLETIFDFDITKEFIIGLTVFQIIAYVIILCRRVI